MEVSQLHHHVMVLSKRLDAVTHEKENFMSILLTIEEENNREPAGDKVAEEVEI